MYLTDLQKSVIIALAENGMRVTKAARAMHYNPNTIKYHVAAIKKKTKLDPQNFFELIKLYEAATRGKEGARK